MRTFLKIWLGQALSYMGSQLTAFALGVWIYQRTGSATLYGLTILATLGPHIVFSPVAGVLVDRWGRGRALLVANAGAGLCSLLLAGVLWRDSPSLGLIYFAVAATSVFMAFEFPAMSALITELVPREQFGRANGLVQLGMGLGQIVAPWAGAWLLAWVGLEGIVVLDVGTFVAASAVLLAMRGRAGGAEARGGTQRDLAGELLFGFRYIGQRPGLRSLLVLICLVNLGLGIVQVVTGPLVLEFSDAKGLGTVLSVGGLGMLVGSVLMVAWGGPRRLLRGLLLFTLLMGLFMVLVSTRRSLGVVSLGAFCILFSIGLINGCSQTLWQRLVPLELQGRVFAVRSMLARASSPLAYVLGGVLVDRLLGRVAVGEVPLFAGLIELGPGRGGALLLILLGGFTMASAVGGLMRGELRALDEEDEAREISPAV